MDAGQAVRDLMDLSTQIEEVVVMGSDGAVLASSGAEEGASGALAAVGRELVGAAGELASGSEVTRVEVELAEGALFVVSDGGATIVARTGSEPASGLVVYDLRTCLRSLDPPAPAKRRSTRSKKEAS